MEAGAEDEDVLAIEGGDVDAGRITVGYRKLGG